MRKTTANQGRPTLDALRREHEDEDEGEADLDFLDVLSTSRAANAMLALAKHAFDEATDRSTRRRIAGSSAIAVVVKVPSPAWVAPVARMMKGKGTWRRVFEHDGASSRQRADLGGPEVAYLLSEGGRLLGVSHAPERLLPAALLSAADHVVAIEGISDRTLRRAIVDMTSGRPGPFEPGLARGLDIVDVAAAIRFGTAPAACLARIRAARKAASAGAAHLGDVPFLHEMHGYGEAGRWGLALCRDIDAWTRGELDWGAVSGRAVLSGPPGCGKTTFARSLAKTAGLPFFATSVGSWFSSTGGYLNEVVKAFDAAVAQASASAPSLLLLDELDALPNRQNAGDRNGDYWRVLINHVLQVLDGAVSNAAARIVIVGATNFPHLLDPALVRPGRLDRIIEIGLPGASDLAAIFRQHLGPDLPDLDLAPVARAASGATGAQVRDWVGRARDRARGERRALAPADLLAAVLPPDGRSRETRWAVAVHEAGHAVANVARGLGRLGHVSIVEGPGRDGETEAAATRRPHVRRDLESYAVVALAGRAAEEVLLGEVTAGGGGSRQSDLATATRVVASIHASFGMGEELVHLSPPEEVEAALTLDRELRERVARDLDRLYEETLAIVRSRAGAVLALAERLVDARLVEGAEAEAIIRAARPAGGAGPTGGGVDG